MTIDPKTDGERLAIALESGDLKTRLDAIAVIRDTQAHLSERALAALIECLGDSRKVIQRRAVDAIAVAAAHDPRVVAALYAALDCGEPRRRWCAAYALSLIGGALDLRAQKTLFEAFANPDGDVRWAAANLIVRLGGDNPEPIRRGLIALEDHPDHNARKMAIYCLRDLRLSDPQVRAMVERASRAAESGVRLAALSLLAQLPPADQTAQGEAAHAAVEIALRCLQSDPDLGVRRAAASALGRFGAGSARAAQALERAASQGGDPALAKAARQALAGIAK